MTSRATKARDKPSNEGTQQAHETTTKARAEKQRPPIEAVELRTKSRVPRIKGEGPREQRTKTESTKKSQDAEACDEPKRRHEPRAKAPQAESKGTRAENQK